MEKSKRNERIAALREALAGRILVLDGGLGTRRVDFISQGAQFGYNLRAQPKLLLEGETTARDGGIGYGGHADTAFGNGHMIVAQLLRRPVVGTHVLKGCRTDGAVAKSDGTYRHWGEKKLFRHIYIIGRGKRKS